MHDRILIKEIRIFDNPTEVKDILIESGIIKKIGSIDDKRATIIDGKGAFAVPGFIDVHIQGAGGADILDGTPEALEKISETLARLGTTSFLGTTVVKPNENNKHLRNANNYVKKNLKGASLLGYHLEGPFINVKKKGGLSPDCIYSPSKAGLEEILQVTDNNLRMMTIAPEIPGNLDLIKILKENNVLPAFAHSDASYNQTIEGFEAGINHVTHIFNAMNPINHREPGPITAIFENDTVTAQIISDGHHLHPATVKMIYRNIGPDRCICITDGVQAMGLPEGRYFFNGREYESKDGAARYLDGTLIGSANSLADVVKKFMNYTGCSFAEAVNSASLNPAKLLGIDSRKGKIAEGYDADIVLMNDHYRVITTLVNSNIFNN